MKNKPIRPEKRTFTATNKSTPPSKSAGRPGTGAAAKHASPTRAKGAHHPSGEDAGRPHRDFAQRRPAAGKPAPEAAKGGTARRPASPETPYAPAKAAGKFRDAAKGPRTPSPEREQQRPFEKKPFRRADDAAAPFAKGAKREGPGRPSGAGTERPAREGRPYGRPQAASASEHPSAFPKGAKDGGRPGAVRHPEGKREKAHAAPAGKRTPEAPLLRSGQTLELSIHSINDDGFGVAHHEGTRVLVAHGLPGEEVVVRVTYVGRREAFGNIIKCLKNSPDRVEAPMCGKGRVCDGCGLMQMRYPAQLAWKKELVTRQMRQYPSLSQVPVYDTIASPQELGYRNSAKLVVSGKNADPVIGMYRRNSHEVQENLGCPLHHPLINKVVRAAKAGIKKGKVPIYNPKSEMGLLRYLVVRVAQPGDRVMVVLVTSEVGYNEMHHLAKYIQKEVPEVTVVAQNINNSTGNVIFGQRDRFLTKLQTLRAKIGETSFTLSPRSFFQVNSGAAHIIYEKVREWAALKGSERVIDLYCGIGGISLLLAKDAQEVVGIEMVESAVVDATENARMNRIDNCDFEAGDAARLLEEIGSEGGADLIVLNPPRKGCEEKVLRTAAALQPQKMIYVSCSPETLARDLDLLSRLGYRTVQVQPVDMFPQTIHVEDVALIERI